MKNEKGLKETFESLKSIKVEDVSAFVFVGIAANGENIYFRGYNNFSQLAIMNTFLNSATITNYAKFAGLVNLSDDKTTS